MDSWVYIMIMLMMIIIIIRPNNNDNPNLCCCFFVICRKKKIHLHFSSKKQWINQMKNKNRKKIQVQSNYITTSSCYCCCCWFMKFDYYTHTQIKIPNNLETYKTKTERRNKKNKPLFFSWTKKNNKKIYIKSNVKFSNSSIYNCL